MVNLGIKALVIFGSQAQDTANSLSDYDIEVIGPKTANTYDTLYDLLSQKINRLVNIDIVFLETAPLELCHHVAKYGQVIYATSSSIYPGFREYAMNRYCDFAYYRKMYQQATLRRIP